MTRSRASAKAAGSTHERRVADHLADVLHNDGIDRRVKTGANDKGDIGGVKIPAGRVVIECKDYGGRLEAGKWLGEAEVERINDNAVIGVVVAKRRGTTKPGEQFVLMTLDDFALLIDQAQR